MLMISGALIAKVAQFSGISQNTFNFVCGVIITIYMIENWSLLMDAGYKADQTDQDKANYEKINNLTVANNTLTNKIEELECKIKSTENSKINGKSWCINCWKNEWNLNDNSQRTDTPPDLMLPAPPTRHQKQNTRRPATHKLSKEGR